MEDAVIHRRARQGWGLSPGRPYQTLLSSVGQGRQHPGPGTPLLTRLGLSPLLKTSPGVNVCPGLSMCFPLFEGEEGERKERRLRRQSQEK